MSQPGTIAQTHIIDHFFAENTTMNHVIGNFHGKADTKKTCQQSNHPYHIKKVQANLRSNSTDCRGSAQLLSPVVALK